jgi:hypothetical protein
LQIPVATFWQQAGGGRRPCTDEKPKPSDLGPQVAFLEPIPPLTDRRNPPDQISGTSKLGAAGNATAFIDRFTTVTIGPFTIKPVVIPSDLDVTGSVWGREATRVPTATRFCCAAGVRLLQILLQKSFCAADQKFFWP